MEVTAKLELWTNIAILVMAMANILLFAGLAFLAIKLKSIVSGAVDQALEKALPKIQPVLDNVSEITGKVSDIVEKVAPRVESIAEESEDTVHSVTSKVKTTSNIVTENVAKPIVNIASLLTGVQRGIEVWKTAKTNNDGTPEGAGEAHLHTHTHADGTVHTHTHLHADQNGHTHSHEHAPTDGLTASPVPPESAAHS